MSNTAVCPECKARPVPAGHYLCDKCENALVAETAGETRRRKSTRSRIRFPRFSMPRWPERNDDPIAVVVDEPPVKPAEMRRQAFIGRERPRWLQYMVFLALVTVGTGAALTVKTAVAHQIADRRVTVVRGYLQGLSDSWRKLCDAMQ